MVIYMDKNRFEALPADKIGHACFEPMVPVYQNAVRGGNPQTAREARTEFYQSLTPGQRALLFFSYCDHAVKSLDGFLGITEYYLSAQIFTVIKKGMEYFNDSAMYGLLSEIEQAVQTGNEAALPALYERLKETAVNTIKIIGTRVKKNPEEYITVTVASVENNPRIKLETPGFCGGRNAEKLIVFRNGYANGSGTE